MGLTEAGKAFLKRRAIACEAKPTPDAIDEYNRCKRRKAATPSRWNWTLRGSRLARRAWNC